MKASKEDLEELDRLMGDALSAIGACAFFLNRILDRGDASARVLTLLQGGDRGKPLEKALNGGEIAVAERENKPE